MHGIGHGPFAHPRRVDGADCRLRSIRDIVDLAVIWPPFRQYRGAA